MQAQYSGSKCSVIRVLCNKERVHGCYCRYSDTIIWNGSLFSFLTLTIFSGRPFHLKFWPQWPNPFKNRRLNRIGYPLVRKTWRKKFVFSLMGIRPRAFVQRDQGWLKIFVISQIKILLSKKPAINFLCVKTFSGEVVRKSFSWRVWRAQTMLTLGWQITFLVGKT